MINLLKIENLTVFKEMQIIFCNGINILIGENGTGKTHLLKILYGITTAGTSEKNDEQAKDVAANIFRAYPNELLNSDTVEIYDAKNGLVRGMCVILYDDISISYCIVQASEFYINVIIPFDDNGRELGDERSKNIIFIPAKEMLTHSRLEKDYIERDLPFDTTLIDILNKAGVSTVRKIPDEMRVVLDEIEDVIGGKVIYKNDRYYIEKQNNLSVEFSVEAEGFKKLGLIYRLIETGYLKKGSILIWDEPESNLNPKLIPKLVDILLTLEKCGVQMFFATHDYIFTKYIEVKRSKENQAMFHSLYLDDNKGVLVESNIRFADLKKNAISDAYNQLLDEVFEDTKRGGVKQ